MKICVLVMSLVMLAGMTPVYAEQAMSGMQMQQETVQASHKGAGKVVAVDNVNLTVKLAHEAIKSLGWPSMTMDFKVAKASVLDGIKAGDAVTFELGKNGKTGKWQIIRITQQVVKASAPR